MSKKTSRILALGLLTSSIVVMGLAVGAPDLAKSTYAESSGNLTELESKVEELELENSQMKEELDRLLEAYSNTLTLTDVEEAVEEAATSSETSSSTKKADSIEYTVTVKDGEPSSVVAEQLESLGIIDDRYDFNSYLEANGYAKKVQPGNYVVTPNMTEQELAQAVTR